MPRARVPPDKDSDPGSRAVAAYLARLPADQKRALERLRETIRSVLPDATEGISYRIPTLRSGRVAVHYAAFESHLSFFPGALSRFPALARELRPFVSSKGTLQFAPERPIPAALVRRIVRARMADAARPRAGSPRPRPSSPKRGRRPSARGR